jgi:hypothetical protein
MSHTLPHPLPSEVLDRAVDGVALRGPRLRDSLDPHRTSLLVFVRHHG